MFMDVGRVAGSNAIEIFLSHDTGSSVHSAPKIANDVFVAVVFMVVAPVDLDVPPSLDVKKLNKHAVGLKMQYARPDPSIVILPANVGMMVLGVL